MAQFNLADNQRAERRLLLTVAEWKDNANGRFYVPLAKEPADWSKNFTDYFEKNGVMKTGWLKSDGKWYYFDGNGIMVTGSRTIGGKRYNFNSQGVCLNP